MQSTGKERDQESGLDYFGARYYGSALGRFTSADEPLADQHPEDPQSWNLYSYVRNNPLRNTDPTGRDCFNGVTACGDYFLGGLKGIVNARIAFNNSVNHAVNGAIAPFTSYQFPDVPTLQGSNLDQRQGMDAAIVPLLFSPVAEAAIPAEAAGAAEAVDIAAGGRLGSAATRAQNAAIADSLESRGFTISGGGGRLPEEYLTGPGGGTKGSTYVDTTATRNGRTLRVQTIDTKADGVTPTTREANAASRIRAQQQPRDHTVLIPKKKPNDP